MIKWNQCSPLAKGPHPVRQVVIPCHRQGLINLSFKNGRTVSWEPSMLHKIMDILANYFLISQPPLSYNTTKKPFPPPKKWWPIKRLFPAPKTSDGCLFCHKKTWFTIRLTSHIDFLFFAFLVEFWYVSYSFMLALFYSFIFAFLGVYLHFFLMFFSL